MKPRDIVPMLVHTANLPVGNRPIILLRSNPGMGKTSMGRQSAEQLNGLFVDPRPSVRDPVDIGGYPFPDMTTREMLYLRPAIFPPMNETARPIIWFADELDKCPVANQNGLLGVFREREVHGHRLADNVSIFAACNPDGSRSGGQKITSALISRCVVVDVENDAQSVIEYAIDHAWDHRVIGYLKLRGDGNANEPGQLNTFDPAWSGPYACPRTWEDVSKILQADYPRAIERELIGGKDGKAGAIGPASNEFLAYLPLAEEMPDPHGVLLDPMGSEIPTKPGVMYGLMAALSNLASASNFQNVVAYCARVNKPYGVFCVTSAIRKHADIKKTTAFSHWAAKNQDVLV